MSINIYYSNHTEPLASQFARMQLEENNIFSPPQVIVPNPHLKKWLQLFTAKTNGISANLQFYFLEEGLLKILQEISDSKDKFQILNSNQLSLYIYHLITNQEKYGIKLFSTFLDQSSSNFHRKAWQLSSLLSKNLIEYELTREDMIKSWNSKKLYFNNEIENYQYIIYNEIFKKDGIRDSINPKEMTLPQLFNNNKKSLTKKNNSKIYMFGLSQISPFHTKLIYQLGTLVNFEIFQLNPCTEFWEDVSTPSEDRWQKIKKIQIAQKTDGPMIHEELDKNINENDLLKLWGKPGRESVKLLSILEEAGSQKGILTSEWINYDNHKFSNSVLNLLQDQVLYRTTENKKVSQDKSIQVVACPDIYREVESVYNNIIYNLEDNPDLLMTDIAIMVPDMTLYRPVIKYIFDNEKRKIRYSIIDSNASISSLFAKAIQSMIKLIQGNFSRAEIFDFLSNPCFLASQNLTGDDINTWIEWADNLNVFHNYNKEDKPGLKSNNYTWSKALARLRFGRIMEISTDSNPDFLLYKDTTPYQDLNTGNTGLIESLCNTIESLHAKISKIKNNNLNASQWIKNFHVLIDTFLEIPDENPEEIVVKNSLLQNLDKLLLLDELNSNNKLPLVFEFIAEFINESLINTPGSSGNYLIDGINISSLVPKRQIPFKIIYIMGMQEGIFPGSSDYSSLDLRNLNRKIGDITRADANRYLFLENLILAKEKLYLTYISMDLQKDQEFYPNSLINQLMFYLKKFIINNESFETINIPFQVFSNNYLKINKEEMVYNDFINYERNNIFNIVNYSNHSRMLLYRNSNPQDNSQDTFQQIPHFSKSEIHDTEPTCQDNIQLRISDIRTFIINPVDSTIRYHLKIYDQVEENRASISEEPLFSTFPFDYRIINDSINYYVLTKNIKSLEEYIFNYYNYSKNTGSTPEGPFGDLDYNKFKNIILDRINFKRNNNISLSEFIESKKAYKYYSKIYMDKIQADEPDELYFNPVKISLNHEIDVEITGSLEHIWVSPDNENIEILVITTSKKFNYKHIISPILFYIISKLELKSPLNDFIKDKNFIINVAHGNGVSKLTYKFTTDNCKNYLHSLVEEMISAKSFDILPISIIMEKSSLIPTDDKANADLDSKIKYRNQLIDIINKDLENRVSSFEQSELFDLLPIEVPEDAYDKIFSRYNMLTKHQEENI